MREGQILINTDFAVSARVELSARAIVAIDAGDARATVLARRAETIVCWYLA